MTVASLLPPSATNSTPLEANTKVLALVMKKRTDYKNIV
jgi:hypothetical protein